jgi:hypothetical protein
MIQAMPQHSAPQVVLELTKNYLHELSDNELMEHFIKFSNRFADSLKKSAIEELSILQAYLRLINSEMTLRTNKQH